MDFVLRSEKELISWISKLIRSEGFKCGEINYVFVNDEELLKLNTKHLNHNTLTDVISFDYTTGRLLSGDIYISVERVIENANIFNISFDNELHRIMAHGLLHYCGYKDKEDEEKRTMRAKENFYLDLINF
jgi:probable rRNA maturation factor